MIEISKPLFAQLLANCLQINGRTITVEAVVGGRKIIITARESDYYQFGKQYTKYFIDSMEIK